MLLWNARHSEQSAQLHSCAVAAMRGAVPIILAEGAIALSVTLSGGALFAS